MRMTRHNGRAGKNGVYNPKHNDRRFNIENSEHIDPERSKLNIYRDICRHEVPGDFSSVNSFSFDKISKMS